MWTSPVGVRSVSQVGTCAMTRIQPPKTRKDDGRVAKDEDKNFTYFGYTSLHDYSGFSFVFKM